MTPFGHNMLDPFASAGIPGDPMESVLSLQTYQDADAAGYNYNSNGCDTVGNTASCYTNTCTTVGITDVCNTIACTHVKTGEIGTAR